MGNKTKIFLGKKRRQKKSDRFCSERFGNTKTIEEIGIKNEEMTSKSAEASTENLELSLNSIKGDTSKMQCDNPTQSNMEANGLVIGKEDNNATNSAQNENNEGIEKLGTQSSIEENPSPTTSAISQNTNKSKNEKQDVKKPRLMTELEKFKRRLIRAISRMLIEEKRPEEEVWEKLKTETSCDCKLLWMRMSAVTIKKLKRLFVANDCLDDITKTVQLSITDWLLFDLVLVHEDVDVIGQEFYSKNQEDPKNLEALYELVLKYGVEFLSGDALTIAWYNLTGEYNSQNRKCSPMLLQRRWYQMKEQVRFKFYSFWYAYRGDRKKLVNAEKFKPTELQLKIVDKFMYIVTTPLKKWEQLIEEKKVALYEDFERLKLSKKRNNQKENEPDIEVIEPHVETIELDLDSDCDDNSKEANFQNDEKQNEDLLDYNKKDEKDKKGEKEEKDKKEKQVKTESVFDLCDDEVSALEKTVIPLEERQNIIEKIENITDVLEEITEQIDDEDSPVTKDVIMEVDCTVDMAKTPNIEISKIHDANIVCEGIVEDLNSEEANDVPIIDQVTLEKIDQINNLNLAEQNNDVITTEKEDYCETTAEADDDGIVMPKIASITCAAEILEIPEDDVTKEINETLEKAFIDITKNKQDSKKYCMNRLNIDIENEINIKTKTNQDLYSDIVSNDLQIMDGIELEDDGIEFIDEDVDVKGSNIKQEVVIEGHNLEECDDNETPKIDLKLLLNPVVYTKRLDEMDVFRYIEYNAVKDNRVIEYAAIESKPVDKKSVNMKDISEELDKSKESDNCSDTESEYVDTDLDEERISITSWMFRKLKSRATYNPIQLCKNPDFNTRLKRLTPVFFSFERNRALLRECKPLTIDFHKAFESKLIDNTIYLKNCQSTDVKSTELNTCSEIVDLKSEKEKPCPIVIQTIGPPQKNQPSTDIMKIPKQEFAPETIDIERSKVINLPDINQIRRTNEKLLVAEVTPIQKSIENCISAKPPVTLIGSAIKDVKLAQIKETCTTQKLYTTPKITTASDIRPIETTIEPHSVINIDDDVAMRNEINKSNAINLDKYQKKKLTKYVKCRPINVTWNPQPTTCENDIPTDRLLAIDTVNRIISVCKGVEIPVPFPKKLNKIYKMKAGRCKKKSTAQISTAISDSDKTNNKIVETAPVNAKVPKKTTTTKLPKTRIHYHRRICCWARNKLDYFEFKTKRITVPHNCPEDKCQCCCIKAYCERLLKMKECAQTLSPYFQNIIEYECNQSNAMQLISEINERNHNKVSVGINTESNQDFDETCAASAMLDNLNTTTPLANSCYLSDTTNKDINNSTQTVIYKIIKPVNKPLSSSPTNSVLTIPDSTIISDVESVESPIKNDTPSLKGKAIPQCELSVYSGASRMHLIVKKPENVQDSFDPSTFNTKNDSDEKRINHLCKKPIFLGKNKILLYSFKSISEKVMMEVIDIFGNNKKTSPYVSPEKSINCPPVLIPNGVHLALLPNQELVASIDPGVELDPKEVANLPNIIEAVQRQLINIGVVNREPVTKCTSTVTDVIQLSDEESPSNPTETNKMEVDYSDTQNVKNISSNDRHKLDATSIVENVTNKIICNQEESVVKMTHTTPATLLNENKYMDVGQYLVLTNKYKQDNIDNSISVKNANQVTSSNTDSSKKTILSDLMEMSGISLEDTALHNTEAPFLQTAQNEIPLSYPIGEPIITNPNSLASAQDESNNSIHNNPFVQAALLKCPELNIVSKFEELRNVFENNGIFYKMDITNGVISPVSVCVKKRFKKKVNVGKIEIKSVIDLTADDENKNEQRIPDDEVEITETSIAKCLTQRPVKPLKLFKAVHPSLLRKSNVVKCINVNKRRKLHLETKSDDVDETSPNVSESDDDEPLALKVKRKRKADEISKDVKAPEEINQGEVSSHETEPVFEIVPLDESATVDSQEVSNNNLRVQPVFLNNDDAAEEDCILGV